MAKLYSSLILALSWQVVNALNTSINIPLNIPVAQGCVMLFNVPQLHMVLVPAQISSVSTTLSITCTNGTPLSLSVTSKNNWHLVGASTAESVNYSMLYTGGGQTAGANLTQTWSGGVQDRVVMYGVATATQWVIPLQIFTDKLSSSLANDLYTDQISFLIIY